MNSVDNGSPGGWRRRRSARKAEGKRRWEESRVEREQGLVTMPCRFLGATSDVSDLAPGQTYWLKLGLDALELSAADSAPAITLPWESVIDVVVEDASEARTGTRVEHHRYGWFGGLLRTMPVGMTESSKKVRSYVGVRSGDGEFLLELDWEAATLRGHLLRTKPRWAKG